jgi:hypothetical protein
MTNLQGVLLLVGHYQTPPPSRLLISYSIKGEQRAEEFNS